MRKREDRPTRVTIADSFAFPMKRSPFLTLCLWVISELSIILA